MLTNRPVNNVFIMAGFLTQSNICANICASASFIYLARASRLQLNISNINIKVYGKETQFEMCHLL